MDQFNPHRQSVNRRAFTLIEVMVVVIVIGVLSAMIIPNLGAQRGNAQLMAEAERLLAAMRYAQMYAAGHGSECRVAIARTETGETGYRLQVPSAEEPSGYRELKTMSVRPVVWSSSIRLDEIQIQPGVDAAVERTEGTDLDAETDEGTQAVAFYPSGTADAALIRLATAQRVVSVVVEPNTGRAQIVRGAVESAPNLREDLDAG